MLCRLIELLTVKVKYAELRVSFEVLRVLLDYYLKVRNRRIFVLRVLLECLGHAKVCIDAVRVNLKGMLEVLDGPLPFS